MALKYPTQLPPITAGKINMTSTRVSSPLVRIIVSLSFALLTCRPEHTCPPNPHPPKTKIRSDTASKANPPAHHPTLPPQTDYSHQGRKARSNSTRRAWSVVSWGIVWVRLVEGMTLLWSIGQRGNGWTIYVRALEVKEGLWADSLERMHTALRLCKWMLMPTMGMSYTSGQSDCITVSLTAYSLLSSFLCTVKRSLYWSGRDCGWPALRWRSWADHEDHLFVPTLDFPDSYCLLRLQTPARYPSPIWTDRKGHHRSLVPFQYPNYIPTPYIPDHNLPVLRPTDQPRFCLWRFVDVHRFGRV
jgi:hypothetical protein